MNCPNLSGLVAFGRKAVEYPSAMNYQLLLTHEYDSMIDFPFCDS